MSSTAVTQPMFVGTTLAPCDIAVDVLFIPVFESTDALEDLGDVDQAIGGALGRARASGEFRAKLYDVFLATVVTGGWKAGRVAFVGAGERSAADAERVRRIAATCGYVARQRAVTSVGVLARGLSPSVLADGVSAAEFDNGTYKSDAATRNAFPARVEIVVSGGDSAVVSNEVHRGRTIAACVNITRGLANEPANVLTPREFATRVAAIEREVGLRVDVLDETAMRERGMNLLLAVAQGSAEPPRLIAIHHDPPGAPESPVFAFVGKGVTFDTGGISIKPADGMERMKDDMAGGAAVTGAMRAIKLLGAKYRTIGIIPTVENMPGGRATRPGDVVIGASGTSVEIINTDAEGRLILADALWYARTLGATHIVDIATLTGACMVALGRNVSGLFGVPDAWVETVRQHAQAAGDRLWPMPIYEEAREELHSEIADLVNSAGRAGGAVTAAAFLRAFAGTGAWAHLDIAGTAWAESRQPYQPKGATGVAVRTLVELAMTGAR